MRRMLAITIALLLGFTLTAPLFVASSSTMVPECCRRNGMHQPQPVQVRLVGDRQQRQQGLARRRGLVGGGDHHFHDCAGDGDGAHGSLQNQFPRTAVADHGANCFMHFSAGSGRFAGTQL